MCFVLDNKDNFMLKDKIGKKGEHRNIVTNNGKVYISRLRKCMRLKNRCGLKYVTKKEIKKPFV